MRCACDRYMFMRKDERRSRLLFASTLPELTCDASVRRYLGTLAAAHMA